MSKRLSILICIFSFLLFLSCRENVTERDVDEWVTIAGETMGTTYHITMPLKDVQEIQSGIDSVLKEVNMGLSTYISNSIISMVNQDLKLLQFSPATDSLNISLEHFLLNHYMADSLVGLSSGYFDPTVGALVNYWGFGYEKGNIESSKTSEAIDSIMEFTGWDKINITQIPGGGWEVQKADQSVELDFNAIAKGYGVDVVSAYIHDKLDISGSLVEIGGEVVARGTNKQGLPWTLGINIPDERAGLMDIINKVGISDMAMATSGNYRNFYYQDGKKIFHSISPKSGFPEENDMRSATVLSRNCIFADGLATACMVMGKEKGMEMIEGLIDVEAIFYYEKEDGSLADMMSGGMQEYLID